MSSFNTNITSTSILSLLISGWAVQIFLSLQHCQARLLFQLCKLISPTYPHWSLLNMPDYVLPQPFGVPPIISILNPSCLDLALFFLCGIKQNSFCHIFVTFQSSVNFSSNTSCQVLLQRLPCNILFPVLAVINNGK